MGENRKVVYTKHALKEALRELMSKKTIDQITVTELCRCADINRSTFYKYYMIPHDILNELNETLIMRLNEANFGAAPTQYEQTLGWSRIIYESMADWKLLEKSGRIKHEILRPNPDWTEHFGRHNGLTPETSTLLFHFLQYGVAGLTSEWIGKKDPEPPELFAKRVSEILNIVTLHTYM